MNLLRRVVVATAGLIAGGAVLGAVAGAVVWIVGITVTGRHADALSPLGLKAAAVVGASVGTVATPTTWWLFLRRVSLGRAAVGLLIGTVTGGLAGWVLPFGADRATDAVLGGLLVFLGVAVAFRLRTGR